MKKTLSLCVLLAVAIGCGPPPEDKIFPYPYAIDDLDNGLRLVTVTTEFPDVVALYIVVQVGSRNEVEPGRSGFAHLFEHMMFRGTEKFPPEEWEAVMQSAGAETNAYTTDDRTVYHAVFSKEDLDPILEIEADRFQNLTYSEEVFRTETRAVLGEYNKNFASPMRKLDEVVRDKAFTKHTYKHTTMGFLRDVEKMPEMYDYGLQFFDRYYRPEHTIVSIVGDLTRDDTLPLVNKYWGGWKPGAYEPAIPAEPPQQEPKTVEVEFHTPTLPIVSLAFHAPGYDDEVADSAALDVIAFHAFSENSEIYKKLVIEEQKVETVFPTYYDHRDPYLFSAIALVKKAEDLDYVEQEMLSVFDGLRENELSADELDAVKSHLRFSFALGMDSTAAIARTLAHFLGLRRSPETINKRYSLYRQVSPADIQAVAKKYFVPQGRTTARLVFRPETEGGGKP